jgi:acid phosphatase (class A)
LKQPNLEGLFTATKGLLIFPRKSGSVSAAEGCILIRILTFTSGIYALVEMIRPRSIDMINQVKYTYFRKRPYVELEDPTPVPEKEYWASMESSYPSGHSCLAWSVALALAEAIPERGQQLLRRGFEFGYNRQIVGFHWATDIEAARLLACGLIARLHAEEEFRNLIQHARADYLKAISEQ